MQRRPPGGRQNFGEGRGKSLAALTKQHDRLVEAGKAPKVQAVPMKMRQHHKPILDQREEEKDAAGYIGFNNMRGPGRQIGLTNLKAENKWRCATCKQANDAELDTCMRCRDPKKVLVEKSAAAAGRSNSGPNFKQPPMRFTMCKKEPKNKPQITKGRPSQTNIPKPSQQKAFVPQKPGEMMTFQDL